MSVKSWFKNVKNAIVYEKQSFKTFNDYIDKKNKIYPLEDKYDMPNTKLEQEIRVSICGVLYCMEDPFGGLYYEFPDSVAKNCECFLPDGERCTNKNCPVYAANCAYFDAKDAHKDTIIARDNAIKHIFGVKKNCR